MNLSVLEKYVNLCRYFSINPSWKGLNEYYVYNRKKGFQRGVYCDSRNLNTH